MGSATSRGTRGRDRGKEQQWRRWLTQWRQSGLSVRAFCRQHRLSEPSFYNWRRVLQQRSAAAPAFVSVHLVNEGDAGASKQPAPVAAAAPALELVLGQRLLRVPAGFDATTLRRLLAVLEAAPEVSEAQRC